MAVSADTTRLMITPEVTPGTLPASATWDLLRITGEGVNFGVTTTLSNEINPNRGVSDSILTDAQVSGPLNFELAKSLAFEELLAAAFCNDWVSNALTIGTKLKTFSLEKRFKLNDTPSYAFHRFTGCAVNGFSFQVQPGQPITGNFDMLGRALALDTAELTGTTINAAGTDPVMTAPLVTTINLAGLTITCMNNLQLTLTNNIRALSCIGKLGADDQALGRAEVQLQATAYFGSNDVLQKLIDQSVGVVTFTTRDSTTPTPHSYAWTLPRVKLASAEVVAGGTNTDVVANITIAGLYDATDTSLKVVRA